MSEKDISKIELRLQKKKIDTLFVILNIQGENHGRIKQRVEDRDRINAVSEKQIFAESDSTKEEEDFEYEDELDGVYDMFEGVDFSFDLMQSTPLLAEQQGQ